VQTNIVIFDIGGTGLTPAEFSLRLKSHGVRMNGIGGSLVRIVTHYDVSRSDCEQALSAIQQVLKPI
jgi:threonine aldolase